jgi:hypothetical protein
MNTEEPRNHRQRWSERDDAILAQCAAKYYSPQECALKLERSIGAVLHRASELGVQFKSTVSLRSTAAPPASEQKTDSE